MNIKFKYTESLRVYLHGRAPSATSDIVGWIGTLSDAELSEFGQMVRMATRGKPIEDVARFMAAAMPRDGAMQAANKKMLERFLASTYSNIVLERKERLLTRGKLVQRPAHRQACACCRPSDE